MLWSYAFRPFFLLAAISALVLVPVWVAVWLGVLGMPSAYGHPLAWHAHEMVFGFAGAAVAGFALTAVATWTRRPSVAGAPLILLGALWMVARVLFLPSFQSPLWLVAITNIGFGALLLGLMSREVIGARNARNYKMLALLALFVATDFAFFVAVARGSSWAMRAVLAGLWTVVLLVNLIGGRIIPAFTANWLRRRAKMVQGDPGPLPSGFDRFDALTTWLLAAFAFLHVSETAPRFASALGLVTGLLLLVRLARWQGHRTLREPLVWVLHLAFLWIPVGVLLLSAAGVGHVPRTAGMHALTVGAMATMIIAVAGRAALGHTGRALESHPLLTASYVLITLATITRVAASGSVHARTLLTVSGAAWFLAFGCFTWRYFPILTEREPATEA